MSYIKRAPPGSPGFNDGSYFFGGSATLSSVEALLETNTSPFAPSGEQFTLEVTGAILGTDAPGNPLPEPQSLALFGLALAAVSLAHRRRSARK